MEVSSKKNYNYGTSGFRYDEDIMINISEKIGIGLSIIALMNQTKLFQCIGIMITASHNIYTDNGIKIVNSTGEMIQPELEILMEEIVNDRINIMKIIQEFELNNEYQREILIAHDTRRSCGQIINNIMAGVSSINKLLSANIKCNNLGFMTTPELHESIVIKNNTSSCNYVECMKKIISSHNINISNIIVDCAHGVGSITLKKIFRDHPPTLINTNTDAHHQLNDKCGSDYVMNSLTNNSNKIRCSSDKLHASFDGDADRIIFYSKLHNDDESMIHLMDGDHISFLILKYVIHCLELDVSFSKDIKIGIVHTAYSNGGFIDAVDEQIKKNNSKIKIDRVCVPTGIKNLIKYAKQYDVGIYFESNGHGSVIINNFHNIHELNIIGEIFNKLIGDSIANLLGISYILNKLNLQNNDFYNMINRKESQNIKVHVKDKDIYVTNYDQTELLNPIDIAFNIQNILSMKQFIGCRAFVRPSGTEDVLRLYVENNSLNNADLGELSMLLKNILY